MRHHLPAAASSEVKCTSQGLRHAGDSAMQDAALAPFRTLHQRSQLSKGAQLYNACTLCPAQQPSAL